MLGFRDPEFNELALVVSIDNPKDMFEKRGFVEGNTSTPGDFVIERAFAEQ